LANTASNAAPEPEQTDEEGFGTIDVPALVAEEIDPDSREYDVNQLEGRANPFLIDEFDDLAIAGKPTHDLRAR